MAKKSHLLGTTHNIALTKLPKAVQRHIAKNHNLGVLESDKRDTKARPIHEDFFALVYDDWKGRQYLRNPGDPDYVAMLSPAQQQQLFKCVKVQYPGLLKPEGAKVEGRNIRFKLNDLNEYGLFELYKYGSYKFGMDTTLCHKMKYVWSIDAIAGYPGDDNARHHDHLNDPFIKLSPFDQLKTRIDDNLEDRPSFGHQLYWSGTMEQDYNPLALTEPILKTRNLGWAPHLVKIMSDNNHVPNEVLTFKTDIVRGKRDIIIAVGAAHLIGEYGLLKLLQKQGYRIKRARPNATFYPYMPALDEKGRPSKAMSMAEKVRLNQAKLKAKALIQARQKANNLMLIKQKQTYYHQQANIKKLKKKSPNLPQRLERLKTNHITTMELLQTKAKRWLIQAQLQAKRVVRKAMSW